MNNPKLLEKTELGNYGERIMARYVRNSAEKYFGKVYTKDKTVRAYVEDYGDGRKEEGFYSFRNGYYYIPINKNYQIDPARFPNGEFEKFSQVTKMLAEGDNIYTVYLIIYLLAGEDNSFEGDRYGERLEEWAKKNEAADLPRVYVKVKAKIRKMTDERFILLEYNKQK